MDITHRSFAARTRIDTPRDNRRPSAQSFMRETVISNAGWSIKPINRGSEIVPSHVVRVGHSHKKNDNVRINSQKHYVKKPLPTIAETEEKSVERVPTRCTNGATQTQIDAYIKQKESLLLHSFK